MRGARLGRGAHGRPALHPGTAGALRGYGRRVGLRDPARGSGHLPAHPRGDRGGPRDPPRGLLRVGGGRCGTIRAARASRAAAGGRGDDRHPGARDSGRLGLWTPAMPRPRAARTRRPGRGAVTARPRSSSPRATRSGRWTPCSPTSICPRSTVLALTMAFAGVERLREAYAEAIAMGYRFFSFGDAMLSTAAGGARDHADVLTACPTSPSRIEASDGEARAGVHGDAPRRGAHAVLHAGGHQGHRQGHDARPAAGRGRADHPGQHLPPGPAARAATPCAVWAACTHSCSGTGPSSPTAGATRCSACGTRPRWTTAEWPSAPSTTAPSTCSRPSGPWPSSRPWGPTSSCASTSARPGRRPRRRWPRRCSRTSRVGGALQDAPIRSAGGSGTDGPQMLLGIMQGGVDPGPAAGERRAPAGDRVSRATP